MQKTKRFMTGWGDPDGNSSLLGDGRLRGALSQGRYIYCDIK